MNIGGVNTRSDILFAPLAGFSDAGFRLLCTKGGAGLTYTEMVSAKGLCYNNKGSESLLYTSEEENPVAVQLFGSDPEFMYRAAKHPSIGKFDIIDINMGCPVRKVFSNGDGSALMSNPSLIEEIVSAVREGAGKPVTVKMRAGIKEGEVLAVECALSAQKGGAAAVAVHPRFREQMYSGKADHTVTAEVKRALDIPVIANGDIIDAESFWKVRRITGADGFMIGRGALGQPWLFDVLNRMAEYSDEEIFGDDGEILPEMCLTARAAMQEARNNFDVKAAVEKHMRVLGLLMPTRSVANSMKLHLCHYAKNTPNSKAVRLAISTAASPDDINHIVARYLF